MFEPDPLAGPTPDQPGARDRPAPSPRARPDVLDARSTGAVSYVVQVGTDEAFADPAQDDEYSVKTTVVRGPRPAGGPAYFWRVRAVLANGILTQWSDSRDYQIGGLSKPVLVCPEDGPFTDVTDIVLDWEPVPARRPTTSRSAPTRTSATRTWT